MKPDTLITFEHPANEQIRLYLRLEYLVNEFYRYLHKDEPSESKQALSALLKIINVVDRPDLKSKLVQILMSQSKHLQHLSTSPEVDNRMLDEILQQLEQHISYLHDHSGKIGDNLRKNEFLNQIRMHLSHPAGACETTLPSLNLWLNKPQPSRQEDLEVWCQPFANLFKAIALLMKLIRQSSQSIHVIAKKGYYQQAQDPAQPCELLRIGVSASYNVFPKFSANKHCVVVRFMELDLYDGRKPVQTKQDIEFFLRCCRI